MAPRVLFLGLEYAGHKTRFRNLEAHTRDDARIRPTYRRVTGWRGGGAIERFHLLRYGLAAVLVFVGLKMAWLDGWFGGKFPIAISLAVIAVLLALSVGLSLLFPSRRRKSEVTSGFERAGSRSSRTA